SLRVHCLVRANDEAGARRRVEDNLRAYQRFRPELAHRIVPVAGVLDRPRFGLAERAYAELAARAGAGWHAGAEVRWTHTYEALVGANVEGTLHVLRFACAGNVKRLHHVSTVGVFASAARSNARI